jgi:hypothetical protein
MVERAGSKSTWRRLYVDLALMEDGRPKPPKHDPGDGFFMRNLFSPLTKAAFWDRAERSSGSSLLPSFCCCA